MSLLGSCVLLICHDFPAEDEADFNEWYIREHMPERVLLPGFNRGRRFQSIGEGPKFLAIYETTDRGALSSESYLKLVRNFDARSRGFVPRFQSASRTVSIVRTSEGLGEGGVMGLIGFQSQSERASTTRKNAAKTLIQTLVQTPGVVAAHLLEIDDEALTHSRQGHLRQGDIVLPWTLLVEVIDSQAYERALREHLNTEALEGIGVETILQRGVYSLLFGLSGNSELKPMG